jgi:predicted SAM-dependent methyltransferase
MQLLKTVRDTTRRRRQLKKLRLLGPHEPLRIVIGAAGHSQDDWIATDQDLLDVLDTDSWAKLLSPCSVTTIMAEHVWEHLTLEQGREAATHCMHYLKPGGRLRLAVPDGYSPDPNYIESVKPAGTGPGAKDHRVLFNYVLMTELLESAGFTVSLLEYFDEEGIFHVADWDPADGLIRRSQRYDERNKDGVLRYTSLIADGVKPV